MAGEGAPKLLTSGVPVAVPPNMLMTGVAGKEPPVPPAACTGVPPAGGSRLLLGTPGGPGVLSPSVAPTGYRTLNADIPVVLVPWTGIVERLGDWDIVGPAPERGGCWSRVLLDRLGCDMECGKLVNVGVPTGPPVKLLFCCWLIPPVVPRGGGNVADGVAAP